VSEDSPGLAAFASRRTLVRILLGFLVAAVVLSLFAVGVGTEDLSRAFAGARLRWLALGCLSTAVCLVAWGKAWHVVLGVVGIEESFRRLVVTFYAATFANYVTPLGQAGGEPFIAYVLSQDTDASYEDSLASVVTADLLNLLPFFSFATVGLGWLLWQASLPSVARSLALGLLAMAVGVPAITVFGWRFRARLSRTVIRVSAPVVRRVPRLTVAGLRERMANLGTAFDRIAADPRALVRALVYSYVGWAFFALPLYFAARTVGLPLEVVLVFFIVPASTLAGLVPSPGGLGGVELALTGLLVALAGLTGTQAYAVALVYRIASYWFALAAGGAAALYVIKRV
jgi:conserved hypothetical protein